MAGAERDGVEAGRARARDLAAAHARLAAECFNACWELMAKAGRTAAEDEEMLLLAHASLWHWTKRPDYGPAARAIGHWQLSRVSCLLGRSEAAVEHARLALEAARDLNAQRATALAADMPPVATDTVPAGVRADAPPAGERDGETAYLLGYAHEALARAHALAGDPERSEFHRAEAWRLALEVTDGEDRERLLADLGELREAQAAA